MRSGKAQAQEGPICYSGDCSKAVTAGRYTSTVTLSFVTGETVKSVTAATWPGRCQWRFRRSCRRLLE